MNRVLIWRAAVSSSLLIVAGAMASNPPTPVAATPARGTAEPTAVAVNDEREIQALLSKLSEISQVISQNPQSPQIYKQQIAQAEVMLQLANRSKDKERDDWIKMAIDAYYGAAVSSPENDPTAYQILQQLPGRIRQALPGNPLFLHATLQEIQADYMQQLAKAGDNPTKAQEHLRDRLLRFAQENQNTQEAQKAILDAASVCEDLGQKENARRCYAYLTERYPGTPIARKAAGLLWRMTSVGEVVDFKVPLLYASQISEDKNFDIHQMTGKVVVVYFWSIKAPRVAEDIETLKQMTDRYLFRGLEIVYVNLDDDVPAVQTFLSGRLTAGIHTHQKGGLESPLAERFGISQLPHLFVVGRDGKLLGHSLTLGQVQDLIATHMPAVDRKR